MLLSVPRPVAEAAQIRDSVSAPILSLPDGTPDYQQLSFLGMALPHGAWEHGMVAS